MLPLLSYCAGEQSGAGKAINCSQGSDQAAVILLVRGRATLDHQSTEPLKIIKKKSASEDRINYFG